ncbi:MAG: hypothetical protein ACLQVI_35155 [Polyangiaceae bacterium]
MKTEAKDCDVGNATTLGERFSPETAAALKEHEIELISLGRRLRHVLSVHAELNRVTRGRSFLIRHEAMWWMLLGERDMIVVDAASWAKAFYSRGGFLRKLQGPDFRALKRRWDYRTAEEDFEPLWSGEEDDPAMRRYMSNVQREHNAAWRDEAFARLFPGAGADGVPCLRDIDALVDRLAQEFEPLLLDRHENRAHKYEKAGTATMLSPKEVAEHLETCRRLLADFRCLSSNSTFSSFDAEPKADPEDRQAQDVVDHILCGCLNWIVEGDPGKEHAPKDQFYWQRRDAHYARVHTRHQGDDPINAAAFESRGGA